MPLYAGSQQAPNVQPFSYYSAQDLFGSSGTLTYGAGGADSALVYSPGAHLWTLFMTIAADGGSTTVNLKYFDWTGTQLVASITTVVAGAAVVDGDYIASFGFSGNASLLAAPVQYTLVRQWPPAFKLSFVASAGTKHVTGVLCGTNP